MEFLKPIEKMLEELFKQPVMPKNGVKWFIKYLPILAPVGGILQVLSALTLWRAWNVVDRYVDVVNSFGVQTGLGRPTALWFWLAFLSVAVSAVILLKAYNPLKNTKKEGWDLLFLGSIINVAYSFLLIFVGSGYGGGVGSFLYSLIGSAVGFWILFQIRSGYTGSAKTETTSKQ